MNIPSLSHRTIAALAGWALLAAGCASLEPAEPLRSHLAAAMPSPAADCARFFAALDDTVNGQQRGDALATRIPGFPYLRTTRFLASLAPEASGERFPAWAVRLARLDREARHFEIANLDPQARALLPVPDISPAGLQRKVAECAAVLAAIDLHDQSGQTLLATRAAVPDDYDTWKRVVGLYALAQMPFALGVNQWRRETLDTFATDLAKLPRKGRLVRYVPPRDTDISPREIESILARARLNRLGIPEPADADLERLFDAYAPVFELDAAGAFDRIGAVVLSAAGPAQIDTDRPTIYRRLAYARYGHRILPQLNYTAWFPERPRASSTDILSGHLDGLIWRVTLDERGIPLVFDTIHPCGCYHMLIPTARVLPLPQPQTFEETAFVVQTLPALQAGERIVLRLASGTHYLQRVLRESDVGAAARRYALVDDDELRSLPHPGGGRRSVFGPDGIVPGTERGERYLFWPMGIREPGAMRSWGRHAIAFIGRRHFDDPDLIEQAFQLEHR